MKADLLLIIVSILSFISCNDQDFHGTMNRQPDFDEFIDSFKNPPAEYSTAPFWVWNDSVTHDKIKEQLHQFKDNGIHQVIIHPRPGLITEYLSDNWFELVAYAVEEAKKLNMKTWLYDENSFPSGFAGGHVPASLPQNADLVVGLKMHKLNILQDSSMTDFPVILKKIGNSFANISNGYLSYLNRPGDYYAFSKWYYPGNQGLFGGFSYVDLLAYGITERFIRLTMKGYRQYVGDEFGKTIPGIFTDEPNVHASSDPDVIKYTPVLFTKFQEAYGYPLENYLPCLFEKTGDWKNVRHDYYALLLDMFIDRWARPWQIYTDSNRLDWTGHYWEHLWPSPGYVADNMAMYAYHNIPGIDMLFNNEKKRPDQFGNSRAVRELGSVANQLGKKRTLSETYGGSGWDLNFTDMKRLGDWEYALGVNMMNQHLSYMTIKGARKRDFPLSFSYHSPWWKHYKILAGYFHRLSYALSSGQEVNQILIIEPTSTAWMYYSPDQGTGGSGISGEMKNFEKSFREFLSNLDQHQVAYDLGSERIISESGEVHENSFVVGKRNYSLVILPPLLENLEESTYELLTGYIKNGGKVLITGQLPDHIDGNPSRKAKSTFSELNVKEEQNLNEEFFSNGDLYPDVFVPVDPLNWNGRVFHQLREFKDGSLLFLCNFDTLETADILFQTSKSMALLLDPFTGKVRQYPVSIKSDSQQISIKLHPAESALFFLSDNRSEYPGILNNYRHNPEEIRGSEAAIIRDDPNSITLDYCDLEVKGKIFSDVYFYNAADTIFREYLGEIYGFNYNPWSVAIQYRTNILDKNEVLKNTGGFKAHFTFNTDENFVPENIKAVLEIPKLISVDINGQKINKLDNEWWLDMDFGVYDLSGYVLQGKNVLSIQVAPMNVLAELEPVYLIGNFGVKAVKKGWEIIAPVKLHPGSWKDYSLPFYSGSISYTKNYDIDGQSTQVHHLLILPDWKGTVAEVLVNQEPAGLIAWPPFEMEISGLLKPGSNSITVKVYGSIKNQLGPHHHNPTDGFVTPWSFFYAPGHQPPGSEYDLNDYGLMEDFRLVRYGQQNETR